MDKAEQQLKEDRLLRDAAQALLKADVDRVKGDLGARSIGQRAFHRAKDGAEELLEMAQAKTGNKLGVIALLGGAAALWFARTPLMELLAVDDDEADEPNDQTEPDNPQIGDDS